MKIILLITTYNRPNELLSLLNDIHNQRDELDVVPVIANDGSSANYAKVYEFVKKNFPEYKLIKSKVNHGKQKYYLLINELFAFVKQQEFDLAIQLPDDIRLVDDFFIKAITTFENIDDEYKVCLNLLNDFTRKGPNWTPIYPIDLGNVLRIGWVDMCYIANSLFFEALDYSINVDENFSSQKDKSSGVGLEISKRLAYLDGGMYQVKKSLVKHGLHASVMHCEHRKKVPLVTNHEWVTANVASMPPRVKSLHKVVDSIIDQVDELNVYLNEFTSIPKFLNHPKINTFLGDEHNGDLGDVGKFFAHSNWKPGYVFTIDDDLIYSPDYVFKMIMGVERYCRKAVVSIHGRRFTHIPISSYYQCKCDAFRCFSNCPKDEFIHIPGTGVMAFHTDTIKPALKDFPTTNMADIWMGVLCQKTKTPVVMLAHEQGMVKDSPYYDKQHTIYRSLLRADDFQTEVVNSNKWVLQSCPLLQ